MMKTLTIPCALCGALILAASLAAPGRAATPAAGPTPIPASLPSSWTIDGAGGTLKINGKEINPELTQQWFGPWGIRYAKPKAGPMIRFTNEGQSPFVLAVGDGKFTVGPGGSVSAALTKNGEAFGVTYSVEGQAAADKGGGVGVSAFLAPLLRLADQDDGQGSDTATVVRLTPAVAESPLTPEITTAAPGPLPPPAGGEPIDLASLDSGVVSGAPMDPQRANEEMRLLDQPAQAETFHRSPLGLVLASLAKQAGMSYVSDDLTKSEGPLAKTVDVSLNEAPFRAILRLAKSHNVTLVYDEGVWGFRPQDDDELVARNYDIKFNNQEKLTVNDNGPSSNSASSAASSATSGSSPDSGGQDQLGLGLGPPQNMFQVDATPLVKSVQALLGISTSGKGGDGPQPQALYTSDTSSLYVVATRRQQELVRGYLDTIDRPQPLVMLEVKFVESDADPTKQLGFDWAGTMSNGYGVSLSGLTSQVDFNHLAQTRAPSTAVLSGDDVNVRLRAFLSDNRTTTVSYPTQVTLANRETIIRSVVQQPVLSSASATTGTTGVNTSSIVYIPIGTRVNLLANPISSDAVKLGILINVSSISGSTTINDQPYPITYSRDFNNQSIVQSGYTLAVGGLDQTVSTDLLSKFPFLGDVPFFGIPFRSKQQDRNRRHLTMFITPTILASYKGGLTAETAHVLPRTGQPEKKYAGYRRGQGNPDYVASYLAILDVEVARDQTLADEKTYVFKDEERIHAALNDVAFCIDDLTLMNGKGVDSLLRRAKDDEAHLKKIAKFYKDNDVYYDKTPLASDN